MANYRSRAIKWQTHKSAVLSHKIFLDRGNGNLENYCKWFFWVLAKLRKQMQIIVILWTKAVLAPTRCSQHLTSQGRICSASSWERPHTVSTDTVKNRYQTGLCELPFVIMIKYTTKAAEGRNFSPGPQLKEFCCLHLSTSSSSKTCTKQKTCAEQKICQTWDLRSS